MILNLPLKKMFCFLSLLQITVIANANGSCDGVLHSSIEYIESINSHNFAKKAFWDITSQKNRSYSQENDTSFEGIFGSFAAA